MARPEGFEPPFAVPVTGEWVEATSDYDRIIYISSCLAEAEGLEPPVLVLETSGLAINRRLYIPFLGIL